MLGHGFHLRLYEGQIVLGGEYIKVGLAQAHHQVLLGGLQLCFNLLHLQLGLRHFNIVARFVQLLCTCDGAGLIGIRVVARLA